MKKISKFLTCSAMGFQVIAGSNAFAQSDNENSDEIQESKKLEIITVQAQRRTENLQEVPAAITAITGAELVDAGISDLKALGQRTPGVFFENQSPSRPVLVMRGVGQSTASAVGSTAVGVFVDGVYMPRVSSAMQNLGNVSRVEVLKGPQGTLYGRNTIGGALSIYTKKPSEDGTNYIEGSVANRGSWKTGLYLDGQLSEDLIAGSLALSTTNKGGERTGLVTNKETGEITSVNNDREGTFARGRLIITPADDLEIDLIVNMTDETVDAVLEEPIGGAPLPFTTSPLAPGFSSLNPAFTSPTREADAIARADESFYSNDTSAPGGSEFTTTLLSATVNYEFNNLQFTSISGYYNSDFSTVRNFDGTGFDIVTATDNNESESFSQELRLSSIANENDSLEWLAGLFYFSDEAEQSYSIRLGTDSIFAVAANGGAALTDTYFSEVDTESYAVFGQASYSITDALRLTLGLRYSKDELDFVYNASTDTPGLPIVAADFTVSDSISFESTDPRVAIDYQFSDNLMAFITYNEGYRSGGIQFATPFPEIAEKTLNKETVTAWEAGIKSRWFDDRVQLNSSIFTYEYKDMQRNGIVNVNGVPVSLSANAAGADIKGFEFDFTVLATDNLILEASYSYLDTGFSKYDFDGLDLTGNSLPLSPENSYRLSANYYFELADWESSMRVDYSWRDEVFFEENNSALNGVGDDVGLLDASIVFTSPDDNLDIRLFCANCLDEEYIAFTTLFGGPGTGSQSTGDRRRIGLSARYSF
jgi:iron complex outermembrane receptor protein